MKLFSYLKHIKLTRISFRSTDSFFFLTARNIVIYLQPASRYAVNLVIFTWLCLQCFHHVALMACLLSCLCGALPAVTNSNSRGLRLPKSLKSTSGMRSLWIAPSLTLIGQLSFRSLVPLPLCMYTINIKEEANVKISDMYVYASRLVHCLHFMASGAWSYCNRQLREKWENNILICESWGDVIALVLHKAPTQGWFISREA